MNDPQNTNFGFGSSDTSQDNSLNTELPNQASINDPTQIPDLEFSPVQASQSEEAPFSAEINSPTEITENIQTTSSNETIPSAETAETAETAIDTESTEIHTNNQVLETDLTAFEQPQPQIHRSAHATDSLNKQPDLPKHRQKKKLGLFTNILLLAFFATVGYGGFLAYQNYQLSNNYSEAQIELQSLKEASYQENLKVNSQFKASFLNDKQQNRIFWTNVLHNFESSLPAPDKLNISSIAGSGNGTINVSVHTTSRSLEPFFDTANLITALKTKPFFENIFIPSINAQTTQSGQGILSYTLRLKYNKDSKEKSALAPTELTPTDTSSNAELSPEILELLRQNQQFDEDGNIILDDENTENTDSAENTENLDETNENAPENTPENSEDNQ